VKYKVQAIVAPHKTPHLCENNAQIKNGNWHAATMAGPAHHAIGIVFLSGSFTRW
jgi:hypothetical protein